MTDKNYKEIIENFCDEVFVTNFLNQNKETLKLKGEISAVGIKIHHRRYQKGKRLITTCYFHEDDKSCKFTFKIRIYNGKNLAQKAWLVTRDAWEATEKTSKYIIEPVAYFDEYDLFVYKTAPGKPLSDLLKRGLIDEDNLTGKISSAAFYLAKFHNIDVSEFSKKDFYSDHNMTNQISSFYDYLGERDTSFAQPIRDIINKVNTALTNIGKTQKCLVHGDFQIENLVFDDSDKLRLIDFDLTEINDPLIDVGNFLVQIYYGGWISRNVNQLRELFLNEYLKNNPQLDRHLLNERINIYASLAKIRNLTLNIFGDGEITPEIIASTNNNLERIQNRLDNLSQDPLSFFLK